MNIKLISTVLLSLLTVNCLSSNSLSKNANNNYLTKCNIASSKTPQSNTTFKEYSRNPLKEYLRNVFTNEAYNGFDTKEYNWYFKHRSNGMPPESPKETVDLVSKYDCYYLGDTSKKILYLTFDEGYENGHTAHILDVLKKHNVNAAFFVVKPYITSNPDLIKRMVDEGHLVCNHSARHPSMASIKDQEKFNKELIDVEEAFEEVTEKKMPKYFRPPMGKYSELSLHYTKNYGYKTIFWSFAYNDWQRNKQPSPTFAKKRIMDRTHNGAVILLHAVSKTNAEILDSVITEWKNQGYEIKSLNELPN
ncbi:delta-lactam-biosynthetic de-N-acetylase [Clostridium ganghwense]|uniref:Delta-lactam-biosynthetic de-N-acetylase n=1 Tax=Clostridium ganghwense TaxID=312089 RepID=A0ABT4CU23_9CLOT|nr:delta-lactam-biosynthetic de-N-acetylase [Clostridium ganghwense]